MRSALQELATPQAEADLVTVRLDPVRAASLVPQNRAQVMVFARMYTSGTFSCRLRVRASRQHWEVRRVTVLGVHMPDSDDAVSSPVLQYMDAEKYYEIQLGKELRAELQERVRLFDPHQLTLLLESLSA